MGRHSAPERDPAAPDGDLAGADGPDDGGAVSYAASHAAPDAPSTPAATSPTGIRADLHLLRTRRGVRWRCLGAVVASFAIYTLVMVLLRRTHVYALWLWIPIVVSGVLVGAVLDLAHKHASERTEERT